MTVKFTIPHAPKGQGRPRATAINGHARVYKATADREYETLVQWSYKGKPMLEGNIKLHVNAYFAIPKSTTKKNTQLMINNELRPTKKPDGDNILKAICDALNKLAYDDDKQIVDMSISKWYTISEPRCEVEITN